jgi:CDP-6-deoxy-D-xylo-4-hexulose-3-dehydrase
MKVPAYGEIHDDTEMKNVIDVMTRYWLTEGKYCGELAQKLKEMFGAEEVILTNSGSSANLLMISALKLKRGSEVILPAVCFPTMVSPIVQLGLVPVFVDVELESLNIDPEKVSWAIGNNTEAIFILHNLGNPCLLNKLGITPFNFNILEDVCDALGSEYKGHYPCGDYGDMATLSFFAAHHLCTGEGGALICNNTKYSTVAKSMANWGRDCRCKPGQNNTCGKRFQHNIDGIPYDHKYIFSELGYNFKMTETTAAIGVAQLDKLEEIKLKRQKNFWGLYNGLKKFEPKIKLHKFSEGANPFAFPITCNLGVERRDLTMFLEKNGIETRLIFAGNVVRQPFLKGVEYRVVGDLINAERIMRDTFFIGCHPLLTEEHVDYVVKTLGEYFK